MFKSLIISGQRVVRTTRHQPSPGFLTPLLSPATRTPFTTTSRSQNAADKNHLMDREKLDPERSEGTESGTDSEVAHHESAYDPHNTAPESEMEAVGKEKQEVGKDGNPLDMSAANSDVSSWRGPEEEGPVRNVDKPTHSGKGVTPKSRSIHVKEDGSHVSYRD
ncbi:hypothetical protein N7490_003270 [Penicillium lividum]|nr:hypothetical protein N7490_003270 [Penicillium lividum]